MKLAIKLLVSVALIAWVVSTVDLDQLLVTLKNIPPLTILSLCVCYILGQLLSTTKWWLITNSVKEVPFLLSIRAYFLGMFVNVAGVGTVGGDMTRALAISQYLPNMLTGLATVAADRLHGLTVLAIIGVIASLIFGFHELPLRELSLIISFGVIVILGWFFGPALAKKFSKPDTKLRKQIDHISDAFPRSKRTLTVITLISIAFHLLQIGMHAIMLSGVGVYISWTTLLSTIPFVNIASSLPISWQGLGVRENAYRFFFVPLLITNEQAVAMGAMWLFAVTISGLCGGGLALISGDWRLLKTDKSPSADALAES